jgi:hypothetical protein
MPKAACLKSATTSAMRDMCAAYAARGQAVCAEADPVGTYERMR